MARGATPSTFTSAASAGWRASDSGPQTHPPWEMQFPSSLHYQTEFRNEGNIALTNSTKAKEAEVVLAAAEARNPEIFRSTKELELISFYDFAEDPMKHHNGSADP